MELVVVVVEVVAMVVLGCDFGTEINPSISNSNSFE
jgi:hypothetical protein